MVGEASGQDRGPLTPLRPALCGCMYSITMTTAPLRPPKAVGSIGKVGRKV
jgi:hypothetical protein